MAITTEIVTMKTNSDIEKNEFKDIVNVLEENFHAKQDGFIDTELLYDASANEWIMIQHWASSEQLKTASKKMFQVNEASAFIKSLDRKHVKMKVLPQIKIWK